MKSVYRIDSMNPMISEIIEMIRDKFSPMVKVKGSVEIVQNEVSREPKIGPPEWIWNPRIKVKVIWRRSIICDYRRSLIIIIVVYYRGFGILSTWVHFMGFTRCIRSTKDERS